MISAEIIHLDSFRSLNSVAKVQSGLLVAHTINLISASIFGVDACGLNNNRLFQKVICTCICLCCSS